MPLSKPIGVSEPPLSNRPTRTRKAHRTRYSVNTNRGFRGKSTTYCTRWHTIPSYEILYGVQAHLIITMHCTVIRPGPKYCCMAYIIERRNLYESTVEPGNTVPSLGVRGEKYGSMCLYKVQYRLAAAFY